MALTRKEKEKIVLELHEKFKNSAAVLLTNYQGLTVAAMNELRTKLRDVDGEFKVSKNTFMKMAAKETDVEGLSEYFEGPNAIALAYEDPVAVAKALVEFAKDNEALEIRAGVLNGKYMDADGIVALSKLPSREVLLAKLLSVLVATPTNMVQVLAAVPRKLLYALKAIEEQKS